VVEGGGDSGGVFLPSLLSYISLLNPFSVFCCSLSLICSSSSSSVLLALAELMVAGMAMAAGKPDDCGCASSSRCRDTNVCVFLFWSQFSPLTFSSPLLLPFLPLFSCASFLFFFLFVVVLVCWWWRLFLSKPFFPLNVSSVFSLVSTFGPLLFHDVSLLRSHFSFSLIIVVLSLGLPHFLFQTKTFQLPSSPPFFLSCTPSVFIGRGSEGHPALPSHGRAWWHAWGRLLHSRPSLCRAWPFWREGVVVSVKGQVGALVFWVLGERERIKKWEGKCFFFPCSLRVQGKKKAYGAVQNGTVCFFFFFLQ